MNNLQTYNNTFDAAINSNYNQSMVLAQLVLSMIVNAFPNPMKNVNVTRSSTLNFDCDDIDFHDSYYGIGVDITGKLCQDNDNNKWAADIHTKLNILGVTVLSKDVSLDNDHQRIDFDIGFGIITSNIYLESFDYTLYVGGQVSAFGWSESFREAIISWKNGILISDRGLIFKNLTDCQNKCPRACNNKRWSCNKFNNSYKCFCGYLQ